MHVLMKIFHKMANGDQIIVVFGYAIIQTIEEEDKV